MLIIAAALIFLTGIAHSYLGERYILVRLFRRDNLPKLFGSDDFTKATLRFAWHLTSIAWYGFALILIYLSENDVHYRAFLLYVVAGVALVSGILSAGYTKGRHLSWLVFLTVALLCLASVWEK